MLTRYIFPIILIAIGVCGVLMPQANFSFFYKLSQIVPKGIQFAPMYQMVFGLVAIIGFIGIVEVFITNKNRKDWKKSVSSKPSVRSARNVNYSNQNLPRGYSRKSRR